VVLPIASPARARRASKALAGEKLLQAALDGTLDDDQATSKKLYDAVIKRLLARLPSASDMANTRAAIEAYAAGRRSDARTFTSRIKDGDAKLLAIWFGKQRGTSGTFPKTIAAFAKANPMFPVAPVREAAETALLTSNRSADEIMAFFADQEPRSRGGQAALARAHYDRGDLDKAAALLDPVWSYPFINRSVEKAIQEQLPDLMTSARYKRRIDALLMRDSRWRGTRSRRMSAVRRLLPKVDDPERKAIVARMAVYNRARSARTALSKHTAGREQDWGMQFSRIQLARRDDKDDFAWELLAKAPKDTDQLVAPDDWWIERRVNAYNALYADKPELAYQIVTNVGDLSVNPRKEALFMAGWIALRHLNKAADARPHFEALTKIADGPHSLSRGHYWLGRTEAALGNDRAARAAFKKAGTAYFTYYGQQALHELDASELTLPLADAEELTASDIRAFLEDPAMRSVAIAKRAGLKGTFRRLLRGLRKELTSPTKFALLAHMARTLGDTQMSVRVGKSGLAKGAKVARWAYPTQELPRYTTLRNPPETAILYGIARQESEFNTTIKSGAGATGILQVMPATARGICRQYKVRCNIADLKRSPAFNTQLASAYLGDQVDNHGGSYIMAFAAYNAGPGRVRYWVRNNGDPRSPGIDPIDWVEMIHIKETRLYVQKVLANVQVYRARLAGPENALRISQDMLRARRS